MERADSSTQSSEPEAGSPPGAAGWFARWGGLVTSRPRLVAALVLAAAALAALSAALGLRVRPGYVDLLSKDSPVNARYVALLEELGNVEALYLVVTSEDEAAAAAFVDALGPELSRLEDARGRPLVSAALTRVEPGWLLDRLPAFLPEEQLRPGSAVHELGLDELAADPNAASLTSLADRLLREGLERGTQGSVEPTALRAITRLLQEIERAARGDGGASPGRALLGALGARERGRLDEEGRLRLGDGRFLVSVTPADASNDYNWLAGFLAEVRAAEERVSEALGEPAVRVLHAGAPVLIVDEMEASRRDVTRSSLFALLLVSLLFLASFHSLRHVGAAVAALLAGLGLTFGAALLLVGSLNLFSIVFAAVLIGLGIDFGIHVVNGHEAALRAGRPPAEAAVAALRVVGPATALGALTTAAAFFTTTTSEFKGFSQLGLITGVGVLLCLVTAFSLLPALLVLGAPRAEAAAPRRPWTLRWLGLPVRHPRIASAGALLLLAAAAWSVRDLSFDYDLLNLQPAGTEAVALSRGEGHERVPTHQAFSLAPGLETAASRAAAFRSLPSVASVSCACDLLPTDLESRSEGLAALSELLRPPAGRPAEPARADPERLADRLVELEETLLEAQDLAFEGGRDEWVQELGDAVAAAGAAASAVGSVASAVGSAGAAGREGLVAFDRRLRARLESMARTAAEMARGRGASAEDLPPALRARLVTRSGRLALSVEPAEAVWDREALERFVAELRSVDPEVTGPPVQILEITEMMRRSYERAALLAFAVIALLVLATLRSLLGTVLTLAPLLAGFLLMLGALSWFGIPLNPANLVALPLVLGIGVDNGIHVAHRWLVLRDVRTAVFEVGHAIVVTSLTTMAGFAGLLVAAHRGVRSLGAVAVVGSCAMLLGSVVLLPAVLKLLERRPTSPPSSES